MSSVLIDFFDSPHQVDIPCSLRVLFLLYLRYPLVSFFFFVFDMCIIPWLLDSPLSLCNKSFKYCHGRACSHNLKCLSVFLWQDFPILYDVSLLLMHLQWSYCSFPLCKPLVLKYNFFQEDALWDMMCLAQGNNRRQWTHTHNPQLSLRSICKKQCRPDLILDGLSGSYSCCRELLFHFIYFSFIFESKIITWQIVLSNERGSMMYTSVLRRGSEFCRWWWINVTNVHLGGLISI